jgi:hypothetical protein
MGAHARERALMRHSIDKEVKPLADLFRDAVFTNTARLAESMIATR